LKKISKFYDKNLNGIINQKPYFKKIKTIYVLSRKGLANMKSSFGLDNVYYLPHIAIPEMVSPFNGAENNFLHFGFIGKNKGIEYSLQLHQQILKKHPESHFYIAGKAMGSENTYLNQLKKKYRHNTHFLGYVEEERLNDVFSMAGFAIQGFNDYKFYWPVSGSILRCLQKGRIVLSNDANAVTEILNNGNNGFILTGNLANDAQMIDGLFSDNAKIDLMKNNIHSYLLDNHSPFVVKKHMNN
jgi:glycosyltransferase involved in cell wall biosynthesis